MTTTGIFRVDANVPHPTIEGEQVINGAYVHNDGEQVEVGRSYTITFDPLTDTEPEPLTETVENTSPPVAPELDPTAGQ